MPARVLGLLLYLSRLRSEYLLARALAETLPTSVEWDAFMARPEVVEELDALASVVLDIRRRIDTYQIAPDEAAAPHVGRLFESVVLLTETLGISPVDLIIPLINA